MAAVLRVLGLLLLVTTKSQSVQAQREYRDDVQGVGFGGVKPDAIMVTPDTGFGVLYMDEDVYIPGNILYIEGNALITYNPTTNDTDLIVGDVTSRGYREGIGRDALFFAPASLYQPTRDQVIVVDSNNGCFRTVSRSTNGTSRLAGLCSISSFTERDGSFFTARFGIPEKVAELAHDVIAASDSKFKSIRSLNLTSEEVTVLAKPHVSVFGLALRPGGHELYFTHASGFGKVDLETLEVTLIVNNNGYRDGPFNYRPMFSSRPETLIFLTPQVLLVSDLLNHALRVVDLEGEIVSSICGIGAGTQSGYHDVCKLSYPRSLLHMRSQNKVMIGLEDSIGYIEVWAPPVVTTTVSDTTVSSGITPSTTASTTIKTSTTIATSTPPSTTTKTSTTTSTSTTTTTPTTTTTSTTTTATTSTPTAVSTTTTSLMPPSTTAKTTTTPNPTTTSTSPSTLPSKSAIPTLTTTAAILIQGATNTVPPSQSTTPRPPSSGSKLSEVIAKPTGSGGDTVQIVGIIVGGLVIVAMLVTGAVVYRRKNNKNTRELENTDVLTRSSDAGDDDYQTINEYERITSKFDSMYEIPDDEKPPTVPPVMRATNNYHRQNSQNDNIQAKLGLDTHTSRPRTENEYVSVYNEQYESPSSSGTMYDEVPEAVQGQGQRQVMSRGSIPLDEAPGVPHDTDYICMTPQSSRRYTNDNICAVTVAEEYAM